METNVTEKQSELIQTLQFLTFCVGREQYGINLISVREIKSWSETTTIPNTPEFMKGVINLRGVVIPIFDLRARFGQGCTEIDEKKSVVIVVDIDGKLIGILVDAVSDIIATESSEIKGSGAHDSPIDKAYINGLVASGEKMIILLNVKHLFKSDALREASEAAEKAA